MKRIAFFLVALAAFLSYGKAVLPSQVYKRGLTNEQIDYILAKHPNIELRMTQKDWQNMRFELCRYQNISNWCDIVTDKEGFAALLADAQDMTNTLGKALNALQPKYIAATNDLSLLTAAYDALDGQYQTATNRVATALAKLNTEVEDLYADKETLTAEIADLDEKIADSKYILLRAWLKTQRAAKATQLATVEARIEALELKQAK